MSKCQTVADRFFQEQWLRLPNSDEPKGKLILVNRTGSYPSNKSKAVWKRILKKYKPTHFIGLQRDCDAFNGFAETDLERMDYDNALDAANIISNATRLLCDQSSHLAIANGLGIPVTVEVSQKYPDCIFERRGAEYLGASKVVIEECKVVCSQSK